MANLISSIMRPFRERSTAPQTYHMMTWNVGTNADYKLLYADAPEDLTPHREQMFTKILAQFEQLDLVCLQEVFDIAEGNLFPEREWAFHRNRDNDTSIAWKKERFTLLQDESVVDEVNGSNSTVLLLEERATHRKVRLVSAHIIGFNLEKKEGAEQGNNQLKQLLSALERSPAADVTLLGMDANTDRSHSDRLDLLKGYATDENASATRGEHKLDWIFAHSENCVIKMRAVDVPEIANPSDHLPCITQIII